MRDVLRRYVGRRVIIQVDSDSIGGTLAAVEKDGTLVLTQAALVDSREPVEIDGAVIIAESRARWVQAI